MADLSRPDTSTYICRKRLYGLHKDELHAQTCGRERYGIHGSYIISYAPTRYVEKKT